jgi:pimeloyl-ACP methyl ester carboxylesterase
MRRPTIWCVAAAATTFLIGGVALSHRIEPDVVVRKVTITRDTPALRFLPTQPGPHPVALLTHGSFCSKKMFFRYGEALAHAGFECVAIDFPGHGESTQPFRLAALQNSLTEDAQAIGPIDVFIGHSMGGYAGGEAARAGGLSPRLFIAIGSLPMLGKPASPLLLKSGQFDQFVRPALVRAKTDARVEIFPWCDHVLELYDAPGQCGGGSCVCCCGQGAVRPSNSLALAADRDGSRLARHHWSG